jgi:hypothetical protein
VPALRQRLRPRSGGCRPARPPCGRTRATLGAEARGLGAGRRARARSRSGPGRIPAALRRAALAADPEATALFGDRDAGNGPLPPTQAPLFVAVPVLACGRLRCAALESDTRFEVI